MNTHDGWAHVEELSNTYYSVVIHHFEGESEVWYVYTSLSDAEKEADLWNQGLIGEKQK